MTKQNHYSLFVKLTPSEKRILQNLVKYCKTINPRASIASTVAEAIKEKAERVLTAK